MDTIAQLIHLAYQFGPFAFALIFLILMARWGQKKYGEACTRANPLATAGEKRTYLNYFYGVTLVGIVLVGLSVYWWWYHQPQYLYEGQINRLSETDTIEGTNLFARNEYYQLDKDSPGPQIRDIHFLLLQEEPFKDGQEFSLRYFRDRRLSKPLILKVHAGRRLVHFLDYDQKNDEWTIKPDKDAPVAQREIFPLSYAETPAAQRVIPRPAPPVVIDAGEPIKWSGREERRKITPEVTTLIKSLQNAQTLVSTKVEILDKLQTVSAIELAALFTSDEFIEPPFVTLFDLTRHTDKEVAAKSERLVAKAPLPVQYFASLLESRDPRRKGEALDQFFRLDLQYSNKLLVQLEKQRVDVRSIASAVKAGTKPWLMVPTGTAGGDKYFVRAEWDPKNYRTVSCLTKLFDTFVMGGKTPQENLEFMKLQSIRYAYESDKTRALEFAQNIQRCSATATFVGYYTTPK